MWLPNADDRFQPHVNEGYTVPVLKKYLQELRRLQIECIDLIQLHCPPTPPTALKFSASLMN